MKNLSLSFKMIANKLASAASPSPADDKPDDECGAITTAASDSETKTSVPNNGEGGKKVVILD